MPLTHEGCPSCGGHLHTDDLIEAEHVTGCGDALPEGVAW